MKEVDAQQMLARHFNWAAQIVIPNVYFGWYEMDVAVVTKAGYLVEVEIKMTTGDWNADRKKEKWLSQDRDYVSRFFYAVPTRLINKIPHWVPPQAGLIELCDDGWCRIHREAARTKAGKLGDKKIQKLLRSTYFRFWHQWMRQSGQ